MHIFNFKSCIFWKNMMVSLFFFPVMQELVQEWQFPHFFKAGNQANEGIPRKTPQEHVSLGVIPCLMP